MMLAQIYDSRKITTSIFQNAIFYTFILKHERKHLPAMNCVTRGASEHGNKKIKGAATSVPSLYIYITFFKVYMYPRN